MNRIINITNHTMTAEQFKDAQLNLDVMEELALPENLRSLWGAVPPDADSVRDYVSPLLHWLSSVYEPSDIVWVQGEWGVTLSVVDWCRNRKIRCVYATTERVAQEIHSPNGVQMSHVFRHVRFRNYFD